MNAADLEYRDLLRDVLNYGEVRPDRTATGVRSVFGRQMRFDLGAGFPLLTTKAVHFKSIVAELLWFLSGSSNSRDLEREGVTIWKEWASADGSLGPIYGHQWRSWGSPRRFPELGGIDQIGAVLRSIRDNPYDRAHLVSAWNVADLHQMALRPCHVLFQFYVGMDGRLSCALYQRSGDIFLGLPFNMASYALLTLMVARATNLEPGELVHMLGDVHLYENHVEQARTLLEREPMEPPSISLLGPSHTLDDWKLEDVNLVGYRSHPAIPAPVAV